MVVYQTAVAHERAHNKDTDLQLRTQYNTSRCVPRRGGGTFACHGANDVYFSASVLTQTFH